MTHIKGKVNRDGIRKMTPREWARLQGYPDNFIKGVADASAYKQFGNSAAVPAIQATAEQIIKRLSLSSKEYKRRLFYNEINNKYNYLNIR